MNRDITLLLLAPLLIAGCATTAKYKTKVQSWMGKDVETLTQTWGMPDVTEKAEQGGKVLIYVRLKRQPVSYAEAQALVAQRASEPQGLYIKCSTYFEVDSLNKISTVLFRGDDCTSRD